MTDHNQRVRDFFEQKKQEDPEFYEKVASKYPMITHRRINNVRRREITAGLLGLMPARIDLSTAILYDVEAEAPASEDE